MASASYIHNRRSVLMLKYHLIWVPRRWHKVLVGAVAARLEELLSEKVEGLKVGIELQWHSRPLGQNGALQFSYVTHFKQ
jgi:REP element-mobilizing transposase RayT